MRTLAKWSGEEYQSQTEYTQGVFYSGAFPNVAISIEIIFGQSSYS